MSTSMWQQIENWKNSQEPTLNPKKVPDKPKPPIPPRPPALPKLDRHPATLVTVMVGPPPPRPPPWWLVFVCLDADDDDDKFPALQPGGLNCHRVKNPAKLLRVIRELADAADNLQTATDIYNTVQQSSKYPGDAKQQHTPRKNCNRPVWLEQDGIKVLHWSGNYLQVLGQVDLDLRQAIERDLVATCSQ